MIPYEFTIYDWLIKTSANIRYSLLKTDNLIKLGQNVIRFNKM